MPVKKKVATAKNDEKEDLTTSPVMAAETTPTASSPTMQHLDTPQGTTSASELYAVLQAAVAEDPAKVNDFAEEIAQTFVEAEKAETPLLLRVRMLEFFAKYGQHMRDGNALKKVVTSLVKILSGPDNTQQLLVAAVQGIAALGPVSMLDKKWEYLSREGADVLMQVMIDENGFAEPVRSAASKALDTLVSTAFRPVVTKLLHWLSDDREAEEEDQLQKERRTAMARLRKVAQTASFRPQWTEEIQEHVLALIIRVLSAVTITEFAQLARIAASLPSVEEKKGLPLLTAFLASTKLNTDRALESLSLVAQHVGAVTYDLTPMLDEAGLLSAPVDGTTVRGMWHAKLLLLAARSATPENTDTLYKTLLEHVMNLIGDGNTLPEYLTTLEALLLALTSVGQKKPLDFVKQLKDEQFTAKCRNMLAAVEKVEPLLIYAVKRLVQKSSAGAKEAEMLGSCHNLRIILSSFSSSHIPMGAITESWAHKHKLPVLRQGREGLLPSAKGGRSGYDAQLPAVNKRPRTESNYRPQSNRGSSRDLQGRSRGWKY
ncbi:uncharacterized protein TEOVI_000445600 [Trypanosoma equiperdum]|uniref:Uncharacterized protein n=1 Tax=Trypanosoma equiperdum TaxID=5694 RepID=A0A1G4IJZ9_TRYEQ|nr:hypothetical protein, conserved [Trypanosoma equiperdum]